MSYSGSTEQKGLLLEEKWGSLVVTELMSFAVQELGKPAMFQNGSPPERMLAENNPCTVSPYAMWHHFWGVWTQPVHPSESWHEPWKNKHRPSSAGFLLPFFRERQEAFYHQDAGFGSCPLPFVHVCNWDFIETCFRFFFQEGESERRWSNCNRFTPESFYRSLLDNDFWFVRTCHAGSSCVNIDPGAVGWDTFLKGGREA